MWARPTFSTSSGTSGFGDAARDRVLERGVVVRVGDLVLVADRLPERQGLLVAPAHLGDLALPPERAAEGLEQTRPQPRVVLRPGRGLHRLQPRPRLGQMAVLLPEPPHRERDADRHRRIRLRDGPVEDRADVVVLQLEPVQPAPLVGARQLGGRLVHERDVPVAVAALDQLDLAVGLQALGGVRPDRVQEPEARFAVGRLLDLDQALVGERHEPVQDVAAELLGRPADRLGRASTSQPPAKTDSRSSRQRAARRRAGRSSRRSRRAASAGGRAGRVPPPRGRRAACSRRARIASGESSLIRAAASSMASGSPWRRALMRRDGRRVLVGHGEPGLDGDGPLDEQADRGVLAERDRVDDARLAAQAHPVEAAQLARIGRGRAGPGPGTPARPRCAARPGW